LWWLSGVACVRRVKIDHLLIHCEVDRIMEFHS